MSNQPLSHNDDQLSIVPPPPTVRARSSTIPAVNTLVTKERRKVWVCTTPSSYHTYPSTCTSPLSPNCPSFSMHDKGSINLSVPYQRRLHLRSASDAATEREATLKATNHLSDTLVRSSHVREGPLLGKLKEPSWNNMRTSRRPHEEDDAWEPVPNGADHQAEELERVSPSVACSMGQPHSNCYPYKTSQWISCKKRSNSSTGNSARAAAFTCQLLCDMEGRRGQ